MSTVRVEEDFPRGGDDVITPLERRTLRHQAQQDILFGKVHVHNFIHVYTCTIQPHIHVLAPTQIFAHTCTCTFHTVFVNKRIRLKTCKYGIFILWYPHV